MDLGQAVKKVREEKGLSQNGLSEITGINQGRISQIEGNEVKINLSTVERLADGLGIPIPVLFWFAMDESDVKDSQKEAFEMLKKPLDALVESFFIKKSQ